MSRGHRKHHPRLERLCRFDVGGCPKRVLSSPPSSSRVAARLRSLASTASRRGGCPSWSPATAPRATRRSSRARGDPHSSPNKTPDDTVELIVAIRDRLVADGHDAGADTIIWHLAHDHQLTVSRPTVHRILTRHGRITPQPKKRPRSSYIRFQADLPNEMWQADFTHWRLADGTDVEILCWIDDHSRYAISVTAHRRVTGPIVVDTFTKALETHGVPASTLTDNGMVFTTRLSGGKGGRNGYETLLDALHVTQKNSPTEPPDHLRQSRTLPPDPQTLAHRPPTGSDARRAPSPARPVRRRVQPAATAQLTRRPHPHRRLPRPTQSHRHRQPPSPLPRPTRPRQPRQHLTPRRRRHCTTSASAATSTEPPSSCSSTTSTCASSTPPPARSSAPSPSTPTAATTAPEHPPADPDAPTDQKTKRAEPSTQVRPFPMS